MAGLEVYVRVTVRREHFFIRIDRAFQGTRMKSVEVLLAIGADKDLTADKIREVVSGISKVCV